METTLVQTVAMEHVSLKPNILATQHKASEVFVQESAEMDSESLEKSVTMGTKLMETDVLLIAQASSTAGLAQEEQCSMRTLVGKHVLILSSPQESNVMITIQRI